MKSTDYAPTSSSSTIHVDQAMRMKTPQKPQRCPWCGSMKIAIMLNGMPIFIPELEQDLDNGGLALGNSDSSENEPAWQCTDCCAQFFREDPDKSSE